MSLKEIYIFFEKNDRKITDKKELYFESIKLFDKEKVKLVMYDKYQFIADDLREITEREEQDNFRKDIISRYSKCIITGNGELVCEACHIKPYKICKENEKYDINNGLLLDANHHKLFDKHLISINPETFQLEISHSLDKDAYHEIWKNNKKQLNIFPLSKIYLKSHYSIFSNCL